MERCKRRKGSEEVGVRGNNGRRRVREVRGRECMEVCLPRCLDEVMEGKEERKTRREGREGKGRREVRETRSKDRKRKGN